MLDRPFMTEDRTIAALAGLHAQGLVEFNEEGDKFQLTDIGFDKAWELMEVHSDEDKVMIYMLTGLMDMANALEYGNE